MRHSLIRPALAALIVAFPAGAQVQAPTPPAIERVEQIELDQDRTLRMTVPVTIGGRGPYSFIVDTGSERTVIARELAVELGLGAGPRTRLVSLTEASRADTVVIPRLQVGRRTVEGINAPALARHDLGAEGLLGIDSLRSQRVMFDFVRGEMTVTPSRRREEGWPDDTIVVTARSRFGHLMLVDADFEGERVYVIVDTGAQVTIANGALRGKLERRGRLGPLRPIHLASVTGGEIAAEYGVARRIRIGSAIIQNLPVAFADVLPFHQMRLTRQPAILLGMDALRLFDRASFDFANRRVRLLMPETSERGEGLRLAGRPATAGPAT